MQGATGNPGGTHSGTGWWLMQRISALVMLLAGLALVIIFWRAAPFDYTAWHRLFEHMAIKLLTWLLVASLCLHAWIGLRDVLIDYARPLALRLVLYVLVMLILAVSVLWAAVILWKVNG